MNILRIQSALILLLALLVFSCASETDSSTPLPTISVRTSIVEPGSISVVREFAGGLVGVSQADLYARISESVEKLAFEIGDRIRQGEVIVYLDKRGSSSRYYQAQATFDNARKTFAKMENLYEQKAIAETEFDASESRLEVARADFQNARERVEITSPISGRLVELNVEVGDVPLLGSIVARVARTDSLRMIFGVPRNLVDKFRVGMSGQLMAASDSHPQDCTVTKISSAADPETRTFNVEVSIPNLTGLLQPGSFAKVRFIVDQKPGVLTIPQQALISNEGLHSVFVVERDTAYARTVTVGIKNGTSAEIADGLSAGEEIVQLGQNFLSDGYPIIRSKN